MDPTNDILEMIAGLGDWEVIHWELGKYEHPDIFRLFHIGTMPDENWEHTIPKSLKMVKLRGEEVVTALKVLDHAVANDDHTVRNFEKFFQWSWVKGKSPSDRRIGNTVALYERRLLEQKLIKAGRMLGGSLAFGFLPLEGWALEWRADVDLTQVGRMERQRSRDEAAQQ